MQAWRWIAACRHSLAGFRSRLFPASCRLCRGPGLPGRELCAGCQEELPWIEHGCRRCALPLPAGSEASVCAGCQQRAPLLDGCRALFEFRAPVDGWVHALKFRQQPVYAHLLGSLLAEQLSREPHPGPVTVLPVPLHRRRLAARGYNQSLLIARPLAEYGYRLDPACCRRGRKTPAQSDLPANLRKANIRGAFETARNVEKECFLLVDDVMTTGATLEELAATLKRAGAARVEACVVARAIRREGRKPYSGPVNLRDHGQGRR